MFNKSHLSPYERAEDFANLPILLVPVAGACPPSLSIAVANAGGLGAYGALMMKPDVIAADPIRAVTSCLPTIHDKAAAQFRCQGVLMQT